MRRWGALAVALLLLVTLGLAGCGGSVSPQARARPQSPKPTPHVVALEPEIGNYITQEPHLVIHGSTTPGAIVRIDNHDASVSRQGRWRSRVPLHLGANRVMLRAAMAPPAFYRPAHIAITLTRERDQAERAAIAARHQEEREQRERERQEHRAEEEETFKNLATTVPYAELIKDTSAHDGEDVTYTGEIFQIQEEDGSGFMLVAVTEEYGIWTNNIWVNFSGGVEGAKGTIVTFWGHVTGTKEYETQVGGETYVPEVKARYVSG